MSQVPVSVNIGLVVDYNSPFSFCVYIHGIYSSCETTHVSKEDDIDVLHNTIVSYLKTYQDDNFAKIIMASVVNCEEVGRLHELCILLWKDLDIVATISCVPGVSLEEQASAASGVASSLFFSQVVIGPDREVKVDSKFVIANLKDYSDRILKETWTKIIETSQKIKEAGKRIIFINTTAQGGGVSIIRHSTMRLYKLLGVDAHWFCMRPDLKVFEITKTKFHNVLQGVSNDVLTEEDKVLWKTWSKSNFDSFFKDMKADLFVIDDPQPSGMIPFIRKSNPNAKIAYRSHIELRTDLIRNKDTQQSRLWDFLYENISLCDIFVSHPVDYFIPDNVKESSSIKVVEMPAVTDPIDGLDKELDTFSLVYYQSLFNRIALDRTGKMVSFDRPYFIQVSRFDRSKGIPDLIEAYTLFRKKEGLDVIPQLIVTGHGSIDDTEGKLIYDQITDLVDLLPDDIAADIHVVVLEPSDQILNAMLTSALCAFQLSLREGFEIKVTEALLKGVPVIAYKSGGIPLQITNEEDGFLVSVGNKSRVSDLMQLLTTDKTRLKLLQKNAKDKPREWLLTPMSILRWNNIILDDQKN